jgi:hypothetical protein
MTSPLRNFNMFFVRLAVYFLDYPYSAGLALQSAANSIRDDRF